MRCKACNAMLNTHDDDELCGECLESITSDFVFSNPDEDDVIPFDPTPEEIDKLLKVIEQ